MDKEIKVTTLDGPEFIVEPKGEGDVGSQAQAILKDGATDKHDDESWTIFAASQIKSVTVQPKGTGTSETSGGVSFGTARM